MTLEEAIIHAESVANSKCDKCGEEHRQLAEWLKDYQRILSVIEDIKADIQKEENILYHDMEHDFSKSFDVIRTDTVLEIIDKHISGKEN